MAKSEEEKPWDYTKIQQRLNAAEQARYEQICVAIRTRNDKIRQSDINKVLLGINPPDKWITPREVDYFRGDVEGLVVRRRGTARAPKRNSGEKGRVANGG